MTTDSSRGPDPIPDSCIVCGQPIEDGGPLCWECALELQGWHP